jgi:oligopeptide transport system substrate-binding protein
MARLLHWEDSGRALSASCFGMCLATARWDAENRRSRSHVMRSATNARWAIGAVAVSLAASACQGAVAEEDTGVFSASWIPVEKTLEPGNVNDVEGAKVFDMIMRGLMKYDPETGGAKHMVAKKIESDDARNFTITLKKGFTFSNGEKVTARSFVDAWNYTALATNKQVNAPFFSVIEGYAKVHPASGKPTATTLSGLHIKNDQTFTVKLKQKFSTWPSTLGATAAYPLPRAFFDDHAAWLKKPIGNGPYTVRSYTKGSVMKLRKWDGYTGLDEAENGGVDLTVYSSSDKAYDALRSGKLDFLDGIYSPSQVSQVKSEFGDRYISQPAGTLSTLAFPMYDKDWNAAGMDKVRRGLSMAVNRVDITNYLQNILTPATDWTSPVLGEAGGYKIGLCGKTCTHDPARAKKLIEDGGGLPGGKMTITYNADAPNKPWVDAVCGNINKVLDQGTVCTGVPVPTFTELLNRITSGKMNGPFSATWTMDYPLIQDFLQPLYYTGAAANDTKFSNKNFDRLVDEANAATDTGQAISKFQDAERILAQQMPAIPLWYVNGNAAYAEQLSDVRLSPSGIPVYSEIDVD